MTASSNKFVTTHFTPVIVMPKKMNFLIFLCLLFLACPVLYAGGNDGEKKENSEPQYGSVEERRLLLSLRQERLDLKAEKEFIAKRKKELKRLEAEVDKKLDELKKTRKEIELLLVKKDRAEQQRIMELSKMFEKMPPEKAARVFSNLNEELAVSILDNMKTKSAAKLLGNLNKDKAVSLTTSFSSLQQDN